MRTNDSKADAGSGKDEEEDSKRGLSRVESEAEEEAIPRSPKGCPEGLQTSQGSGKRTLGKKRKGTFFFLAGILPQGRKL